MIDVDELARRLCAVGHLAPQRPGAHPVCATHILLARATYPLVTPAEQPQGERLVRVLLEALEFNMGGLEPAAVPIAAGQVGMEELVGTSDRVVDNGPGAEATYDFRPDGEQGPDWSPDTRTVLDV